MRSCYLSVSCSGAWLGMQLSLPEAHAPLNGLGRQHGPCVGAHVIFRQGALEQYTPPHLPYWVPR